MDGAGEIKKGGNNMKSVMKEWFISSQVIQSMLLVQLFATGVQLLSRVILVQGTFIFALIAYRHLVAAIFVAPLALYLERNRPKMLFHWRVWFWLFINALVGMTMALGLFYFGLRDTSATYSINFLNLIPIFTFLTSIICRMENVRLQTWAGKAKIVGAIFCVGGALATSLYKGKEIHIFHHRHHTHIINVLPHKTHKLRGTLFLIGSCCSYTAWFIIQVKLLSIFPLRYWGTMLSCIMAAVQSAIVGVIIDPSIASWRLKWDLQLITILYSGALATAASFCLISWSITIKGPSYPPMFNPLALIFVALAEAIFLGEPLRVGTLLGMVLIISGLYFFLWGKSNDIPQLLAQTNVIAVPELSTIADDPAAVAVALSTVVAVPSSSPDATGVLDIEKAEETPLKPFKM